MDKTVSESDLKNITALAAKWQNRANDLITKDERINQERIRQLILHPLDKAFLSKLIDQCFRSKDVKRIAEQITFLLKRSSFPDFFTIGDVMLMWLFLAVGRHFPRIAVPIVIERIKKDSGNSILPGEKDKLSDVLSQKRNQRLQLDINRLCSATLGQNEADKRLGAILDDLANPSISHLSLVTSSLCPQIEAIAHDHQVNIVVQKLSEIYRTAQLNYFSDSKGKKQPKFVNLDIENCHELYLSAEAFQRTLEKDEFKTLTAGIALQAYLPESLTIQQQLTKWAQKRIQEGGSPIKIRLVKGANLGMEKIKAALNGWPSATYPTKLEVDGNFKKMIDFGLSNQNFRSVRLGIASHNVFDLAYGRYMASTRDALEYTDLEMYYSVAGHMQAAIKEDTDNLVLYAPIANKKEFINSVGYLIRRLDENTATDSFLRHAIGLTTDSKAWHTLQGLFLESCRIKSSVTTQSPRKQDRNSDTQDEKAGTYHLGKFDNEPITDWSLAANRTWAVKIRNKWQGPQSALPIKIPVVIEGRDIENSSKQKTSFDLSVLSEKAAISIACLADPSHVDKAVNVARSDPDKWSENTLNERHAILSIVARNLRKARADLIGATAATTGRVFKEIDIEISRAIDYVEYYPHSVKPFIEPRYLESQGKGVGVVISPKFSPIATPCDGIAAALATGNTVILNPSIEAITPAWMLCQCFWEAGISKNTLQFLPGDRFDVGQKLVTHKDVDFVILNGRRQSARELLKANSQIDLYPQTSGKNSIIITAVSDKSQAVRNVIESAFGDCGQKNSAVSLLILEKEVFNDPGFKNLLVDAAASYSVGSCWDFNSRMGPLSNPAEGNLLRALTQLEPGESWALKPELSKENNQLWTPGIKWNVKPGSFMHLSEFYGPILGVMNANSFQKAIDLANQSGYGVAAGLECLDKLKQQRWKKQIKAGNLFINGATINSFVLRQPFGGWGYPVTSRGAKSGGPNYVTQFMTFNEKGSPAEVATQYDRRLLRLAKNWIRKTDRSEFKEFQADIQKSVRAMNSYLYHARHEFRVEKDFFHLRGQDNIIRYAPIGKVTIRVHPDDSLFEILARVAAAQTAKCKVLVSIPEGLESKTISFLRKRERREFLRKIKIISQSDDQLIASMDTTDRIRYAGPNKIPSKVKDAAAQKAFFIAADPVLMEGRIELLHYYRSQSVCNNYHRYGNLGTRAFDQSMNSM